MVPGTSKQPGHEVEQGPRDHRPPSLARLFQHFTRHHTASQITPASRDLVMRVHVRVWLFTRTVVTAAAPNGNGRLPLAVPLRGSAYE